MKVLVTGGAGLIGSACCELLLKEGHDVVSIDNNTRKAIFGEDADTFENMKGSDVFSQDSLTHVDGDIRDKKLMTKLITDCDAVMHLAAQPSHPRSLEIPTEDFEINALGTFQMLEIVRQECSDIPFAFMSTNKVYGEYPNYFNYKVIGRRFEIMSHHFSAFNEQLPIDACGRTPFGVSKTAADLYTQEYGINFGLKTATFRGGCLTGKNSRAVELHGYLPYIIRCALTGKPYTIFGGGNRVRDQIHSSDVASCLYAFIKNPKKNQVGSYGSVYNVGGERKNSISIFETIDAIKAKTGQLLDFKEGPERESDHIWWITDMAKFKADYPEWNHTKDLNYIFDEIISHYIDTLGLSVSLDKKPYF